jgi:esterase/lipase superfamily enzyme
VIARAADPSLPFVRIRAGAPVAYVFVRGAACAVPGSSVTETAISPARFARELRAGHTRRIVVFVPGFATSVGLAYRDGRRIQAYLGPADRVVAVDWGSLGLRTRYGHDARSARQNAPELVAALLALRAFAPNTELDIFAHSLGTRVVAMAIPHFPAKTGNVVRNVVLAAPDMTLDDYRKAIARVPGPVKRITLYVSHRDRALLLSEIIHLHRRLGQITHWQNALANTEVVDASAASSGPDGHGYAINVPALIGDIGLTLAGAKEPHALWSGHERGAAWKLSLPPEPPGQTTPCSPGRRAAS